MPSISQLPARMQKHIAVDGDCWAWTAYRDKDGYGHYWLGDSRSKKWLVHRLTWSLLVDEIPKGLQMDHLCRNRSCCNPAHLEPVTMRTNVDRGLNYIALNRAKTHCPQSHPYEGANLIVRERGQSQARVCRACRDQQLRRG